MVHIAVEWVHALPDEPVHLYYELDAERYEHRKVEEYQDGSLNAADATHGQGSTFLAWEPHPPFADTQADSQFRLRQTTQQAFEKVWERARQARLQPTA